MINCKKNLNDITRTRQEYITRQDRIRLGMNEYVPSMPQALFEKIMYGFTPEIASSYPEINRAYVSLSRHLKQSRDRLILSNGADSAIKMIFETFCGQGDVVSTISPTFAMYKIHSQLMGCVFREVYCDETGECSSDSLNHLLVPETKLVIIANPNGVTGFSFDIDELHNFSRQAEQKDILVVIDETYADFGNIDMSQLIDECSNVIIVRSFSKNIGMAGLRIGYILTNERLSGMIEKCKSMMEINALAAKAVEVICSDDRYVKDAVKEIIDARKKFAVSMTELGFRVMERDGNFVLVDFGSKRDKILKHLIDKKVEIRALGAPLEKYVRFTVGARGIMNLVMEIIKSGLS